MYAIEADHLVKKYRIMDRESGIKGTMKQLFCPKWHEFSAVTDLSFQIKEGEITGFIGANGAGKSTTMKMLVGILLPEEGSVRIKGLEWRKNHKELAKKIGVVFGQRTQLCWDIPVVESFRLFKDMYDIPEEIYRENIEMFQEILDIKSFMEQPVRQLSLGQRMRADLAAALLHNPSVLFLDEPTIGIDVSAKSKIRQFIKEINEKRRTTVLLTTHDVSDIESLCDEIIIIDHGKKQYQGTIAALKEKHKQEELEEIIKDIYDRGYLIENL